MDSFIELLTILERLLGPGGCPWDQEQTLKSLRTSVLEETCEVIDAIDSEDSNGLREELGDLLLNVVFLAKLAAKDGKFTLEDVLAEINAKLIHRHPHVFGDVVVKDADHVLEQWEAIKRLEPGKKERTSIIDGIPLSLPSLARAQKIHKRLVKAKKSPDLPKVELPAENSEELGEWLLAIAAEAQNRGWDAELALREAIAKLVKDVS